MCEEQGSVFPMAPVVREHMCLRDYDSRCGKSSDSIVRAIGE